MTMKIGAGTVAAAAIAGTALGDYPDFFRPWMPDFDQIREVGGGTLGLPGNGGMYCAPTATLNLMGYLDRHGYPLMLDLAENESFYTGNAYTEISTDLIFMGIHMNTHPQNGTGGGGVYVGTQAWMAERYEGWQFVVIAKGAGPSEVIGPADFSVYHALGCVMTMGYGGCEFIGNNTYQRTGGHVVTVCGSSYPGAGDPIVLWRDPADSNDLPFAQDLFRVSSSPVREEFHFFRQGDGTDVGLTITRLTGFSTPVFLDSMVAVMPVYGMTTTPDYTQIVLIRPFGVIGDWRPGAAHIDLPPGRLARRVLTNVMGRSLVLVGPGGAGGPHSVFSIDPGTNLPRHALDVAVPGPWEICRKGCLWFTDGPVLQRGVINDDGGIDLDANLLLPATPQALCAIDSLNAMAVIGDGSVRLYDEAMLLIDTDSLPGQILLSGLVSAASDPSEPERLFLTSYDSPAIYIMRRDVAAGRWAYEGSIPLPHGAHPTDLDVGDDGHVFFVSGERVHERYLTAAGGWTAPRDPLFSSDEPVGDSFDLPSSRTNRSGDSPFPNDINVLLSGAPEPIVHCGPDLTTTSDPTSSTYGIPDGVLDASDFFYFLDRFVSGDFITCDITGSSDPLSPSYGVPDSELDAGDFFYYLDLFTGGCP